MPQITLRVSDDLLEQIEAATGPETSRSEWLRGAARLRLDEDRDLDQRLEQIEYRLDHLEQEVERPLWDRLF